MVTSTNWIGLAAGEGTRLRPITRRKPKAMVRLEGRPIVQWLLDTARSAGINDLSLVTGYRGAMIEEEVSSAVTIFENPHFESTEMVTSFWTAAEKFSGQVILSYCDILYSPDVLHQLLTSPHDIAVAVDTRWESYWERRFSEPLIDAENLQMASDGRITAIGGKISSMDEPDAQYVGLIKFSEEGLDRFYETYLNARTDITNDGGEFSVTDDLATVHMTDLLQATIDRGISVFGEAIDGGWVEIDTPSDLEIAESVCTPNRKGTLTIDR